MENLPKNTRSDSENRANRLAAIWFSRFFLLLSFAVLCYLCTLCFPSVRMALRGAEQGNTAQAFRTLTDSLDEGSDLREAFGRSYEILIGNEG